VARTRPTAEAVAGAYGPFAARYPTPETVAAVPSEETEALVAPLGLVKRAAYIRRCAHQILARHSGDVPREYSELIGLHGVGDYTARSVLIHAHGVGIAAVDTNVRRLLSRFFDVPPDRDRLVVLADALAPSARCGDFQYAMLDLAAAVCTPASPNCEACPLERSCAGSERTETDR